MPITVLIILAIIVLVLIAGFVGAREHLLKDWMPPVITGLILIGIVPYANETYWKRQKDTELCIQDREKRYELLGSVARTYTHLFKIHTRLREIVEQRVLAERELKRAARSVKPPNRESIQLQHARLSSLVNERCELTKERIRLEGHLAADSALIARFYSGDLWKQYYELAGNYDRSAPDGASFKPTADDPVVKGASALLAAMAKEGMKYEGICK